MNKKIIHITSGRGPAECMRAVSMVLKWLLKSAKAMQLVTNIVDSEPGSKRDTLASVSFSIEGAEATRFSKKYIGVVQWIANSPFRKNHKRKNWYVEIYSFDSIEIEKMKLDDVIFETKKSSGPGGQHVNKTESAVRAIDEKSGLSVCIQESRSQIQNKKIALAKLKELLAQEEIRKVKKEAQLLWAQSINIQRGNPRYIFKGIEFKQKNKQI